MESNETPASVYSQQDIGFGEQDDSQAAARRELESPKRLHPTSIFFGILSTVKQFAFAVIIALFLAGSGNRFALIAAGVAVCMTTAGAIVRYFTLRYRIVDGDLRIDEGLVFRRQRVIPARRIQNIDLLQNPVHHFFKVAEVRIETAGGSEPEAKLRVLSLADVETLREAIFQDSTLHGTEASSDGILDTHNVASSHDRTETRLLHKIQIVDLVRAGLISNRGFLLIPFIVGIFFEFNLDDYFDLDQAQDFVPRDLSTATTVWLAIAACAVLLALFKLVSVAWFIMKFSGYRLERRGDDLRLSCGLFTRISATVPRRRIQFISIHQTLFGRIFGLAAVRIETAGSVTEKDADSVTSIGRRWFIPVIPRGDVEPLLGELRTGLRFDDTTLNWRATSPRTGARLARLAIIKSLLVAAAGAYVSWPWGGTAGLLAITILVYLARRYAKSLKFACTEDWIVFRSGILTRKLSFTFFDKIQAVSVSQSPFDRRWDMATLAIDTAAAGPAQHRIEVKYLPSDVADNELVTVAAGAARTKLTGQN